MDNLKVFGVSEDFFDYIKENAIIDEVDLFFILFYVQLKAFQVGVVEEFVEKSVEKVDFTYGSDVSVVRKVDFLQIMELEKDFGEIFAEFVV